ncbi:VIN3-like protein 2 isoform X2 [Wolffia australiana]
MILEKKMVSEPSDAPPAGLGVNPLKLGEMSVEERRSLVREIHQQAAAAAPELLQSWSRRDLLELLCLEMGNQKKFTGLTKFNIIDSLLTAIAGVKKNKDKKKKKKKKKKKMEGKKSPMVMNSSVKSVEEEPTPSNRRRKNPNPGRLPLEKILAWELADKGKFCRNPGCRAAMRGEESFCRRCSCHLCGKFDENKDPSLWLASKFDHLRGETSYHLECVLNHPEFFHGRVNLLGSLREQLSVARSARRVGALCYRISLSRRIMAIENRLKDLWDAVEMAARELEAEVGNLESLPEALRASEVHGLSSAREVHSLCTAALAMVSSSSSSSPATQVNGDHLQMSSGSSQGAASHGILCHRSQTWEMRMTMTMMMMMVMMMKKKVLFKGVTKK